MGQGDPRSRHQGAMSVRQFSEMLEAKLTNAQIGCHRHLSRRRDTTDETLINHIRRVETLDLGILCGECVYVRLNLRSLRLETKRQDFVDVKIICEVERSFIRQSQILGHFGFGKGAVRFLVPDR